MSETLQRPDVASRDRHPLAADAFLYAAVIFLVGIGIQELIAYLISGNQPESLGPAVWLQLLGMLAMPAAAVGGPLLAWLAHRRLLQGRDLLAAVLGAVIGGLLVGFAFVTLLVMWRFVPGFYPRDEQGPWDLGVVVAVAALAFLAKPVIGAVRDLAGARRHSGRDWLRLVALALTLAAVIVSLVVGGETAELGLFTAPVAAGAACAAVVMDIRQVRQSRGSNPPEQLTP